MKLTYQTIDELNAAFTNLPVKGLTILTVAENMIKLESHIKAVLATKDKLIKQYSDGKENITNKDENWDRFALDYSKVLLSETTVEGLKKVKKADIDFNKEVPGVNLQNVLTVLMRNNLLED